MPAKQEYAIFFKNGPRVFVWVRTDANLQPEGATVLEVKKVPEEISYERIDVHKRELAEKHRT